MTENPLSLAEVRSKRTDHFPRVDHLIVDTHRSRWIGVPSVGRRALLYRCECQRILDGEPWRGRCLNRVVLTGKRQTAHEENNKQRAGLHGEHRTPTRISGAVSNRRWALGFPQVGLNGKNFVSNKDVGTAISSQRKSLRGHDARSGPPPPVIERLTIRPASSQCSRGDVCLVLQPGAESCLR